MGKYGKWSKINDIILTKKWFVFSLCVLSSSILYAEERLIKDIDGDGKKDVIWLEDGTLHIKLSSQNNSVMRDIHEPLGDEPPFLHDKRVGFELSVLVQKVCWKENRSP